MFVDLFQTVGAIFGTIALIIITLPKLICLLYSASRKSRRFVKGLRQIFSEWRWRRTFCPTWDIIQLGKIVVTVEQDYYRMILPIKVKYESRDPERNVVISCGMSALYMYHKGEGGGKEPYYLHGVPTVADLRLRPGDVGEVQYLFQGSEIVKPEVGDSTSCKIMNIGVAQIERVHRYVDLGRNKTINVDVHWAVENQ